MPKYLVTGKFGMLAREFPSHALFSDTLALSHNEFDLTNPSMMKEVLKAQKPSYVINCAAYNNVTQAEIDHTQAWKVNAEGVRDLALLCREYGVFLIHFSSDYVFSGEGDKEYGEDDAVLPVNKYGASKLKGEEFIREILDEHLIIRVSWLYGQYGKNFVSSLISLLKAGKELNVVADQYGKTTFAPDIVAATANLLGAGARGSFHFANEGVVSRYKFALGIKEAMPELKGEIKPIPASAYADSTPRPSFSPLCCKKYRHVTGKEIPMWQSSLKKYLQYFRME